MSGTISLPEEKLEVIRGIARFLNQFVSKDPERPRYSYIDRLSAPYNQEMVLITIQEALREARSAEYWVPREDVVENFLKLCNEDLRYATITSALALTYGRNGEKGGE
ncbi:MAG: hypothetical protein QXU11_12260 [Thermoproteota archaeon]